MHIHDGVVIEAPNAMKADEVGRIMSVVPSWADGLILSAAGYEAKFYMKDLGDQMDQTSGMNCDFVPLLYSSSSLYLVLRSY